MARLVDHSLGLAVNDVAFRGDAFINGAQVSVLLALPALGDMLMGVQHIPDVLTVGASEESGFGLGVDGGNGDFLFDPLDCGLLGFGVKTIDAALDLLVLDEGGIEGLIEILTHAFRGRLQW